MYFSIAITVPNHATASKYRSERVLVDGITVQYSLSVFRVFLPSSSCLLENRRRKEGLIIYETQTTKMDATEESKGITLIAKFGKERISLESLEPNTTIGSVKDLLSEKTGVLPKRQKLIGLAVKDKSKLHDDVIIGDLKLKPSKSKNGNNGPIHEFILMGTKEEQIFVDPKDKHPDELPDVVDDFDLDFNAGSSEWLNHVANGENLTKFTNSTDIFIMNQPREGKPLLVLDLDHTLLDFSRKSLQMDSATHQVRNCRTIGIVFCQRMKRSCF